MAPTKVARSSQQDVQGENINDFVACVSAGGRLKIHAEHDQVRRAERQINKFTRYPEKNRFGNACIFSNGAINLAADAKDDGPYVNASRMPCLGGEVIMAQAPMKETVVDFYRLIWQQQINTVVCLVDLDNKEECFPYFKRKAGEKTTFQARFKVDTVEVRAEGKGIVHYELKVKNNLEKGNLKSRRVNIISIVGWDPDAHFDPKAIVSAIHSADAMRQIVPTTPSAESGNTPAPILIHGCSGIRRTGVFALAYIFSKQILAKRQIDLYGVIKRARDVRYGVLRQKNMFYLLLETIIVLITETGLVKPGSAAHLQAVQIVKQMYITASSQSSKKKKKPESKEKPDDKSVRAARKKKTKVEDKDDDEDNSDATNTQGSTAWRDESTKPLEKEKSNKSPKKEKKEKKEKTEKKAKKEKEEKKEKTDKRVKKEEKKEKTEKRTKKSRDEKKDTTPKRKVNKLK